MTILTTLLPWLQVIATGLLVAAILLQRSGEDLGTAFGGASGGGFLYTKRGLEKTLFTATIVLAIVFAIINILALFI